VPSITVVGADANDVRLGLLDEAVAPRFLPLNDAEKRVLGSMYPVSWTPTKPSAMETK
jgi:hypothetical protein